LVLAAQSLGYEALQYQQLIKPLPRRNKDTMTASADTHAGILVFSDYDNHSPMSSSSAHHAEPIIDFCEGDSTHDGRGNDSLGNPPKCIKRVLPGTISRADDFQLALGNVNGVDRRELCFFTNDHDLPAPLEASSGSSHSRSQADAFERTTSSFPVKKSHDFLRSRVPKKQR
jgi:hypothetical protein